MTKPQFVFVLMATDVSPEVNSYPVAVTHNGEDQLKIVNDFHQQNPHRIYKWFYFDPIDYGGVNEYVKSSSTHVEIL